MLFIIIHQVYELWFRNHQFDRVMRLLDADGRTVRDTHVLVIAH